MNLATGSGIKTLFAQFETGIPMVDYMIFAALASAATYFFNWFRDNMNLNQKNIRDFRSQGEQNQQSRHTPEKTGGEMRTWTKAEKRKEIILVYVVRYIKAIAIKSYT